MLLKMTDCRPLWTLDAEWHVVCLCSLLSKFWMTAQLTLAEVYSPEGFPVNYMKKLQ